LDGESGGDSEASCGPPPEVEPFAVFGLKACDLRAMDILDKVFLERGFEDPFYVARRGALFIIATDCVTPGPGCLCSVMGGLPYPERGYDLNVAPAKEGFLVEPGSQQGREFMTRHAAIFGDAPGELVRGETGSGPRSRRGLRA